MIIDLQSREGNVRLEIVDIIQSAVEEVEGRSVGAINTLGPVKAGMQNHEHI